MRNDPLDENWSALCERDEETLRGSTADQLRDAALLDRAGDELFRLAQDAKTGQAPQGSTAGWAVALNGALLAAAMALRTGRAIALLVRSGYGVEAAGLVRRLGEITQHAAGCAQDPTGGYARNWGIGGKAAGKASKTYMKDVADPKSVREKWGFLSDVGGHATASPYVNLMCSLDERGEFVHPVAPTRHEAADAIALSSAAWDLARTAAALCKAHPYLDDGPTLRLAEEMRHHQAASDARIDAWAAGRQQQMSEPEAPGDPPTRRRPPRDSARKRATTGLH